MNVPLHLSRCRQHQRQHLIGKTRPSGAAAPPVKSGTQIATRQTVSASLAKTVSAIEPIVAETESGSGRGRMIGGESGK